MIVHPGHPVSPGVFASRQSYFRESETGLDEGFVALLPCRALLSHRTPWHKQPPTRGGDYGRKRRGKRVVVLGCQFQQR